MGSNTSNISSEEVRLEKLPMRWALILAIGAVSGVTVGMASDLALGVATAIAAVGLLHSIVGQ